MTFWPANRDQSKFIDFSNKNKFWPNFIANQFFRFFFCSMLFLFVNFLSSSSVSSCLGRYFAYILRLHSVCAFSPYRQNRSNVSILRRNAWVSAIASVVMKFSYSRCMVNVKIVFIFEITELHRMTEAPFLFDSSIRIFIFEEKNLTKMDEFNRISWKITQFL